MFFKKKTAEDYRRERKALFKERNRLRAEAWKREKHQARVNFRKQQTAELKKEIRNLKYGKYKKAVSLIGRDLSRIGKPILAVGKKIATPTKADIERQRRGQSPTDISDILGTTWTGSNKATFDYGGSLTSFGELKRQHREHHKRKRGLLEGIPE